MILTTRNLYRVAYKYRGTDGKLHGAFTDCTVDEAGARYEAQKVARAFYPQVRLQRIDRHYHTPGLYVTFTVRKSERIPAVKQGKCAFCNGGMIVRDDSDGFCSDWCRRGESPSW